MGPEVEELGRALDELEHLLAGLPPRIARLRERTVALREAIDDDADIARAVREEPRPLIVEGLARLLDELSTVSARLRRSEARALHRAGCTTDEIGSYFGVSRQRISALLKNGTSNS